MSYWFRIHVCFDWEIVCDEVDFGWVQFWHFKLHTILESNINLSCTTTWGPWTPKPLSSSMLYVHVFFITWKWYKQVPSCNVWMSKNNLYKQQDAIISKKSYRDVIVHVQNSKYPLYERPILALKVFRVKG